MLHPPPPSHTHTHTHKHTTHTYTHTQTCTHHKSCYFAFGLQTGNFTSIDHPSLSCDLTSLKLSSNGLQGQIGSNFSAYSKVSWVQLQSNRKSCWWVRTRPAPVHSLHPRGKNAFVDTTLVMQANVGPLTMLKEGWARAALWNAWVQMHAHAQTF
jgi:hypothetical protein